MQTIIVKKQAEVPYLGEEVSEFISENLEIVNPVWVENKKMGRWNGRTPYKLRFYSINERDESFTVPRGFVEEIVKFLINRGSSIKVELDTYLSKAELPFKFRGELRPFQTVAVNKMLDRPWGTLCSPTGSGKTVMGLYIMAAREQPTLIIVHTKELVHQWKDRIKTFLQVPEAEIGMIGDGKFNPRPITVSLIQTLRKHTKVLDNYGHLIVDECHRVPSKTFSEVVTSYRGTYITGLSATPYRRDGLSKLIGWYTGNIRHTIKERDLIDSGHIVGVEAIVRRTDYEWEKLGQDPKDHYSELLSEIATDEHRNQLIIDDVCEEARSGQTCLVLSDRKAHCQSLRDMLPRGLASAVLTGDVPATERQNIVEGVNKGEIQVIVATGQLIGEGFDCKNLSALFLTMPIKYAGRTIQYLGRVLRPKAGKNRARIYDYFDSNIKCLYGSYHTRQRIYEKLQ